MLRGKRAALGEARVGVRDHRVQEVHESAADQEAGEHLRQASAVEGGHEEAERGSGEHHSRGEAEERVEQALRRTPQDEDRDAAEARGGAPGTRIAISVAASMRLDNRARAWLNEPAARSPLEGPVVRPTG
jgi:hypothetical protein